MTWELRFCSVSRESVSNRGLSISSISNNLIVSGSVDQNNTVFGQGNSYSDHFKGGVLDGFLVYFCQPSPAIISLVGDSLFCSSSEEVDWYLEGDLIASNQNRIYPEVNGNYTAVSSTFGKCIFESEAFYFSSAGIKNHTIL